MNFDKLCSAMLTAMRDGLGGCATIERAAPDDAHMELCDMDRRERAWAWEDQADAAAEIATRCRAATTHPAQVFVLRNLNGARLALLGLDLLYYGSAGAVVNPWCLLSPEGAGVDKRKTLRALVGAVGLLHGAAQTLPVTFMGSVTERNGAAHAFLERVGFRVIHGPGTFAVYELEQ